MQQRLGLPRRERTDLGSPGASSTAGDSGNVARTGSRQSLYRLTLFATTLSVLRPQALHLRCGLLLALIGLKRPLTAGYCDAGLVLMPGQYHLRSSEPGLDQPLLQGRRQPLAKIELAPEIH